MTIEKQKEKLKLKKKRLLQKKIDEMKGVLSTLEVLYVKDGMANLEDLDEYLRIVEVGRKKLKSLI